MDYLLYADGTYEAVPEIELIPDVLKKLEETGAERIVWLSKANPGKWHQVLNGNPNGSHEATDVPDVVKLAQMLE